MENTAVERQPKKTDNNANQTHYYVTLTMAVAIGLFGVFVRFLPDVVPALNQLTFIFSLIANLAILIAAFIAFKTVFAIMGFGNKK